jgi:hypothetical protein
MAAMLDRLNHQPDRRDVMRPRPNSTPASHWGFSLGTDNDGLVCLARVVRNGTGNNHNETLVRLAPVIRNGGGNNHNETLVRLAPVIRNGGGNNHNETLVRASA